MVATAVVLSDAEAWQLVEIVEEGGAYSRHVRPEVGRALLDKGLVKPCEERPELWTATDAGWDAYPEALRQVDGGSRRQRWTWRWRLTAQRCLRLLG